MKLELKYLRPREKDILKVLEDMPGPIGIIALATKIGYFNTERVRMHLARLEVAGFIFERRPYERNNIALTEAGRAAAAALTAQKEAA